MDAGDDAAVGGRDRAARQLDGFEMADVRMAELSRQIPGRPAGMDANLIDLSRFYNAALTETWFPTPTPDLKNDLAAMPRGEQRFGGVAFDVRGVVQLSGAALENLGARFPRRVDGMLVGRRLSRLHILHGAAWDALVRTPLGSYVMHYADGRSHEMRVIYGEHVREWWFYPTQPQITLGAAIAWQGPNEASRSVGMEVRVYQMTWANPWPDAEVASIDFVSAMEKPAPFLIALTVE
jgi:hypothetical protein